MVFPTAACAQMHVVFVEETIPHAEDAMACSSARLLWTCAVYAKAMEHHA
jgi:hypothetical protein